MSDARMQLLYHEGAEMSEEDFITNKESRWIIVKGCQVALKQLDKNFS